MFHNFPNPSDIDMKFIDQVQPEMIGQMINHLEIHLDKHMAPHNDREKAISERLLSLITYTRQRAWKIQEELSSKK